MLYSVEVSSVLLPIKNKFKLFLGIVPSDISPYTLRLEPSKFWSFVGMPSLLKVQTDTSYWDGFHQVDSSNIPSLLDLPVSPPRKEQSILDFGFGKGRNLRQLLGQGFENLTGFEVSRDCIAQMRNDTFIPVHHFDELASLSTTLRVDVFSMFGVFSTISHKLHRNILVRSINSILKKNGRLIIYDYAYDPLRSAQYHSIDFGNRTHCLLQTSWSKCPFIHYSMLEISDIFADLTLVQATELSIPSFKHSSAPGCLMVFQK